MRPYNNEYTIRAMCSTKESMSVTVVTIPCPGWQGDQVEPGSVSFQIEHHLWTKHQSCNYAGLLAY